MKRYDTRMRLLPVYLLLLAAAVACMVMLRNCKGTAQSNEVADLRDTIVAGVIYSPMSYYIYDDTVGGLNHDMLRLLARDKGMKIKMVPVVSLQDALEQLRNGSMQILASLPVTKEMRDSFLFTESIYFDRQVLVQRRLDDGHLAINSSLDLVGDTVHVERDSPVVSRLENLQREIGGHIEVISHPELSAEYLAMKVANGEYKYAVVNSRTAKRVMQTYPQISDDTPVSFTQFQSWLVAPRDSALLDSLNSFITNFKETEQYRNLLQRYHESPDLPNANP